LKFSYLLLIAFMILIFSALTTIAKKGNRKKIGAITARKPVSESEQAMYFRLVKAFPNAVVLSQVAFSALITSKDRATRNHFNRKVADFVICTKAFEVAVVIELDDASHRGRESHDAKRDALLRGAGYRVLRYKTIPDIERVQIDVAGKPAPASHPKVA
jgi:very-short-patch-repair endonuclease